MILPFSCASTSRQLLVVILATLALALKPIATGEDRSDIVSPNVIGGGPSLHYPWMVSISRPDAEGYYEGHFCGGVLIDPNWILTAAHCVDGYRPREIKLALGSNDLKQVTRWGYVSKIFLHPEYYERAYLGGDLALIQLKYPITDLAPLKLNRSGERPSPGSRGRIVGWGATSFDRKAPGRFPNLLNQADVPILSIDALNATRFFRGVIRPSFIAIGGQDPVRTSFSGDSGGPLIVQNEENEWILAGIASWGMSGCGGEFDYVSLFTDVAYYYDWIKEMIAVSEKQQEPGDVQPRLAPKEDRTRSPIQVPVWPYGSTRATIQSNKPYGPGGRLVAEPRSIDISDSDPERLTLGKNDASVVWNYDPSNQTPGALNIWLGPNEFERLQRPAQGPFPLHPFQLVAHGDARVLAFKLSGLEPGQAYVYHTYSYSVKQAGCFAQEGELLNPVFLEKRGSYVEFIAPEAEATWLFLGSPGTNEIASLYTKPTAGVSFGSQYNGNLTERHPQFHRTGKWIESLAIESVGWNPSGEIAIEIDSDFDAEIEVRKYPNPKDVAFMDSEEAHAKETLIVYNNLLKYGILSISNFETGQTGSFSLKTSQHYSRQSIRMGETQRRALTRADERYGQQYYEEIDLDLTGITYPVTVKVDGLNGFSPAFAIFEDPGSLLIESVNGARCEPESITFTPKSGKTYALLVAVFDDRDLNGNYDLSLSVSRPYQYSSSQRLTQSRKKALFAFASKQRAPTKSAEEIRLALIDAYLYSRDKAATEQ